MQHGIAAKSITVTGLALAIGFVLQAHAATGDTGVVSQAAVMPAQESEVKTDAEASTKATTLDAITVTGIRGSLRTSVARKKETMEIMDSITAEDIGKLPDPNVAETLTRIPGVQGYRYGGEGSSPVGEGSGLTIRGLSGQTASRVDGRAYFTAGGREFNIEAAIPGMIAGIDVYKNPSAEHIEGGIGGVINVRTRKPLDFEKMTTSVTMGGRQNEMIGKIAPDIFGMFTNRWKVGDGEMGVLLSANYQETYNRSDSDPTASRGPQLRNAIRADSAEYATTAGANQAYAGRSDVWYLQRLGDTAYTNYTDRSSLISALGVEKNVFQETIHRVRKGMSASWQWKPNDSLELYAEGNYNYYLYDQDYRFLTFNNSDSVQNLTTAAYTFDENFLNRNSNGGSNELVAGQRMTSGTYLGSTVNGIGGTEQRSYQTWTAAIGANWEVNDRLHANLDLSYIKADQTQDNRSVNFISRNGLTWDISRDTGSTVHQLGISGPSLSDPSNFVLQTYNNGTYNVYDDDGYAAALSFKYDVSDEGFLRDIKFGTRYAKQNSRFNSYSFGGKYLTTDGKALAADQSNGILLSDAYYQIAPNNWMDGDAGFSGGYAVYSPFGLSREYIAGHYPLAGVPVTGAVPENLLARRYSQESTLAGYVVGDFAIGDSIKGNIGVRVVKTDQFARGMVQSLVLDSSGTGYVNGPIVANDDSRTYTNVLPSLNVTKFFGERENTLLRFGYAKAITRPSLAALNPAISVNPATGTGSGGNPDLAPLKADSFDLSLEHYISPVSYVSAAVFYKKISGFPFARTQCMNLDFAPTPTTTNCSDPNQYEVSIQAAAEKGSAKGVELAGQTFLTFLPGIWSNLGMSASYTYLKTENPVRFTSDGPVVNTPMPFQSKYSYSLTGLYEDDKFSARLVYTYRDDFILFNIDAWPSWGRYVKGYGVLDGSLSYNVNDVLSVTFNVSNLLNKSPDRYAGEPEGYASDFSIQNYMNGRSFGLSLRVKFD